jgi:hypothetical protein
MPLLAGLLDRSIARIADLAADGRFFDRQEVVRIADVWDNNTFPLFGAAVARPGWVRERRARAALRWMAAAGADRRAWMVEQAGALAAVLGQPVADAVHYRDYRGLVHSGRLPLTAATVASIAVDYDLGQAVVRTVRVERAGPALAGFVALMAPRRFPAPDEAREAVLHLDLGGVSAVEFDSDDASGAALTVVATCPSSIADLPPAAAGADVPPAAASADVPLTAASADVPLTAASADAPQATAGADAPQATASADASLAAASASPAADADGASQPRAADGASPPRAAVGASPAVDAGGGGGVEVRLGAGGRLRAASATVWFDDPAWRLSRAGRAADANTPVRAPAAGSSREVRGPSGAAFDAAAVLHRAMLEIRSVRYAAAVGGIPLRELCATFADAGRAVLAAADRRRAASERAFQQLADDWIGAVSHGPAATGEAAARRAGADTRRLPDRGQLTLAGYTRSHAQFGRARGATAVINLAVPESDGTWGLRAAEFPRPARLALTTVAFTAPHAVAGSLTLGDGALAITLGA